MTKEKRTIKELKEDYRNSVIEYKGGGYDGCIWEWNYFYIDENGEFVDIFHSGALGGSNFEQIKYRLSDRQWFSFNLKDKESVGEFIDSSAPSNVIGVAKWVNENTEFEILIPCDTCGNEVYPEEILLTGAHGIGGIAIGHDGFECVSCDALNTCANCGARVGIDNLDENGYCGYCRKEEAE